MHVHEEYTYFMIIDIQNLEFKQRPEGLPEYISDYILQFD